MIGVNLACLLAVAWACLLLQERLLRRNAWAHLVCPSIAAREGDRGVPWPFVETQESILGSSRFPSWGQAGAKLGPTRNSLALDLRSFVVLALFFLLSSFLSFLVCACVCACQRVRQKSEGEGKEQAISNKQATGPKQRAKKKHTAKRRPKRGGRCWGRHARYRIQPNSRVWKSAIRPWPLETLGPRRNARSDNN